MIKIKERYVSLEVARLLKEKGFDEECRTAYDTFEGGCSLIDYTLFGFVHDGEDIFLAPTQQMACDWLREKNILITYKLVNAFDNTVVVKVYRYDSVWYYVTTISCDTLEDAVNEALKYSLEKVI